MVGDTVNDLGINNHLSKSNQIRNEFTDFDASKENRKSSLLVECNAILLEQNRQASSRKSLQSRPWPTSLSTSNAKPMILLRLFLEKQFRVCTALQIRE